tara:strand:- start:3763 stop:4185 length:423 start_codon:yes stop_codon:yes gene_type:complete
MHSPEPNAITYKEYFNQIKQQGQFGGKMRSFKNITNKVEFLLRERPELRDSDNKLVARIWYEHIKNTNPVPVDKITAVNLLMAIGQGELPAWSSIVRCRRKIQELNEGLRGKLYEQRQDSQKNMIKNVRNMEIKYNRGGI